MMGTSKRSIAMELFPVVAALVATVVSSYYLGTKHNRKIEETTNDEYERNRIAKKSHDSRAATRTSATEEQAVKGHPSYVVLPALIPDISKVYDVYFASFTNEKMARLMLDVIFPGGMTGSEEFRKNHTAGTLAYWHVADTQYTFKCVDTQTGEIVGMALGDVLLRSRSLEERKFTGIPWLEGNDRKKAEDIIGPLAEMRERLFAGAPHIYVHVIGVTPSHQGRKAGLAMVEWGIDLCDRVGLPIYLESSPTTQGLYHKMGFEFLKEKIVHKAAVLGTDADIEVPLMVRMPSFAKVNFYQWREQGYPTL